MTSGTRNYGNTYIIANDVSASSVNRWGYGQKQWSGADWGSKAKPYKPVAEKPLTMVESLRGFDRAEVFTEDTAPTLTDAEKIFGDKASRQKRKVVAHWRRNYGPKRSFAEEHSYSMVYQRVWDFDYHREQLNSAGTVIYSMTMLAIQDAAEVRVNGTDREIFGWTQDHDLRLLGKLREKVAGSDFDAGTFLAEGNQALKMIASVASRVNKAYGAVRRGRPWDAVTYLSRNGKDDIVLSRRPRKAWSKDPASNWLELQYGWMPLLKDAKSGAEFLAHHLEVPQQWTVRVRVTSRSAPTCQNYTVYHFPGGFVHMGKSIKAVLKEKNVAVLSGLLDPETVIWEKIPFSFVLDWFIPIGNFLKARGLNSALEGTFVTTTYKRWYAPKLAFRPEPDQYGQTNRFGWRRAPSPYRFERVTVQRDVSTSLAIPLPAVKPLKDVVSWKRAANAVSLLLQKRGIPQKSEQQLRVEGAKRRADSRATARRMRNNRSRTR